MISNALRHLVALLCWLALVAATVVMTAWAVAEQAFRPPRGSVRWPAATLRRA
jgi:hypothetical protein